MKDPILAISKIRNREFRKLMAKMWFTSEVIRKMEEYHKWRYE